MKPVTKLVVAILPVLFLIACGDKVVKPDEESAQGDAVIVDDGSGGVTTLDSSEAERLADELGAGERLQDAIEAGDGLEAGELADVIDMDAAIQDMKDLLAESKVYFDFDKSDIKDDYQDVLQALAEFLVANPEASLVIEGHTDERGTREYNIALGERRAHAVFQFLTLQGVGQDQVRTVSFGEERPDVEGHDESAWKWNRRAVFIYTE